MANADQLDILIRLVADTTGAKLTTDQIGKLKDDLKKMGEEGERSHDKLNKAGELSFRTQQRLQNSILATIGLASPIQAVTDRFEFMSHAADRAGLSIGQLFSKLGAGLLGVGAASVVVNKAIDMAKEADAAWEGAGLSAQGFFKNLAIGYGLIDAPKVDAVVASTAKLGGSGAAAAAGLEQMNAALRANNELTEIAKTNHEVTIAAIDREAAQLAALAAEYKRIELAKLAAENLSPAETERRKTEIEARYGDFTTVIGQQQASQKIEAATTAKQESDRAVAGQAEVVAQAQQRARQAAELDAQYQAAQQVVQEAVRRRQAAEERRAALEQYQREQSTGTVQGALNFNRAAEELTGVRAAGAAAGADVDAGLARIAEIRQQRNTLGLDTAAKEGANLKTQEEALKKLTEARDKDNAARDRTIALLQQELQYQQQLARARQEAIAAQGQTAAAAADAKAAADAQRAADEEIKQRFEQERAAAREERDATDRLKEEELERNVAAARATRQPGAATAAEAALYDFRVKRDTRRSLRTPEEIMQTQRPAVPSPAAAAVDQPLPDIGALRQQAFAALQARNTEMASLLNQLIALVAELSQAKGSSDTKAQIAALQEQIKNLRNR